MFIAQKTPGLSLNIVHGRGVEMFHGLLVSVVVTNERKACYNVVKVLYTLFLEITNKKIIIYMKRLFFYIAFSSLALTINAQVIKIDVNPSSQPKGTLMLSELVEHIEYIPLETNDHCIVGTISSFDISDNFIVVYVVQTDEIFLLTRTGRFITLIGRRGQGPGEYISPGSVYIDEIKKCVYVKDGRRLLVYDFSGKHITTVSNDISNNSSICAYLNNQFILGTVSTRPKEDYYVYGIWDTAMKLVKQGVKGVPIDLKLPAGSSIGVIVVSPAISCYIYQGLAHLRESVLNDTIYQLNRSNEFIPKYIIHCGRYGMTPEAKGDIVHYQEVLPKYIGGMTFFETSDFLLSRYYYKELMNFCYFDKKGKKLLYFNSKQGITDDYAGGIDFWPTKQINNYLYAFYDAPTLLDRYAQQKKVATKGPSATVQKVQSVIKKLDTEDNPVLIVAKIKQ